MKQELLFEGQIEKSALMHIYSNTITNLGPLNFLFIKELEYMSTGQVDFTYAPYIASYHQYLGRDLLKQDGEAMKKCSMNRTFLGILNRGIALTNLIEDNKVIASVKDSKRGIKKLKKILEKDIWLEYLGLYVPEESMIEHQTNYSQPQNFLENQEQL